MVPLFTIRVQTVKEGHIVDSLACDASTLFESLLNFVDNISVILVLLVK